ncbi:hypothetical protein JY651_27545 [Pyxidicoccus parkwayensis]|uniref:pyruvate kinase n=1 Tax=Pyxidicoccus parkwayensis TaxID=2813578 RepID=A0ABX7NNK1_9BACT|nr:pyruvate kinase [Pyxidicoccus parkwaysis]QSQ19102.1 hypothetical protein JY651_27545 [Pyxidicoccus parkwaysis]
MHAPDEHLRAIQSEVLAVWRHVTRFQERSLAALRAVHSTYRRSAENLLAYVGLRQLDLRRLQLELGDWGLSSLGRCEGHVLSNLRQLMNRLDEALATEAHARLPGGHGELPDDTITRGEAVSLLHQHTRDLLGPRPSHRHVRIMVTANEAEPPSDEAVAALLRAGMDVLRINVAHGHPALWRQLAEAARRVAAALGLPVRILVDLEGPKLRTTRFRSGPAIVRYRPRKDAWGRVAHALKVRVLGEQAPGAPSSSGEPLPIRVPDAWLARLRVGDVLRTRDSRDRSRELRITEVAPGAALAELRSTCYLINGATLSWVRGAHELDRCLVTGLPPRAGFAELRVGDVFELGLHTEEGHPGVRDPRDDRAWLEPPRIGLGLGGATLELKPGHHVLLDDGKVEAVIETTRGDLATARVVRAAKNRVKIRAGKGVNLPDSEIHAPALSPRDREVLGEVIELADAIGISFVRKPADLREAIQMIQRTAAGRPVGIIVKLETAYALKSLPELLLEAMRHYPVGVMIARGDLAVEVGFERMAELQQEILWFAEAAHLPVVWATQVLETLARTGIPSRAEISDAALSVQAECVMLNKGPYVTEACRSLDVILRKMEQHQFKKRNLYRPLRISLDVKAIPPVEVSVPDVPPPSHAAGAPASSEPAGR